MSFLGIINRFVMAIRWRIVNRHNRTYVRNVFPLNLVTVGIGTYGQIKPLIHNTTNKLLIGNYCSIAPNVTFIVCSDHPTQFLSTYPYKAIGFGNCYEAISKGDIIVDDDVWIGCNATILSGVHIGQGAIIAAGAVVTKDVPPYAIVGGVPAELNKYRFDKNVISKLIKFDFKNIKRDKIHSVIHLLYKKIDDKNVDDVLKSLNTFLK